MEKPKFKFTEEQLHLFKTFGNVGIDGEKTYMFLPAWIEYDEDTKEHTLHYLGKLPERLINFIGDKRKCSKLFPMKTEQFKEK